LANSGELSALRQGEYTPRWNLTFRRVIVCDEAHVWRHLFFALRLMGHGAAVTGLPCGVRRVAVGNLAPHPPARR
jgi:hypothetical protein